MKFDIKKGQIGSKKTDVSTIALNQHNEIIRPELFDKDTLVLVRKFLALGDLPNEVGKVSCITGNQFFARIILVNLGDLDSISNKQMFKSFKSVSDLIKQLNIKSHSICFDQLLCKTKSPHQIGEYFSRAIIDSLYVINSQKSDKKGQQKLLLIRFFLMENFIKTLLWGLSMELLLLRVLI